MIEIKENWKVIRIGNINCPHENVEYSTLTSYPPIPEYRCIDCHRIIWGKPIETPKIPWPENDVQ